MKKKFICPVCGYVYEGEEMPEKCPICGKQMQEVKEDIKTWAAEHIVGVAKDAPEDIKADLRMNFEGECKEVGMYLAMARVAHREGYPEVGLYWEKAAWEEAEHAAKCQGSQPRCHPRHRPRDGSRRSPPRQSSRRSLKPLFHKITLSGLQNKKGAPANTAGTFF